MHTVCAPKNNEHVTVWSDELYKQQVELIIWSCVQFFHGFADVSVC